MNALASAGSNVTIPGMYATDTILTFGFPIGRLAGARFRISFLFPIVAIALMWRFNSVEYGLLTCAILLFSVLLHELAHLVVARSTGGEMDEVGLWPLGGLEEPYGRGYWQDHLQTMLAGPVTNLLIALSCLLTIPLAEAAELLNPAVPFSVANGESIATTVCRMAFLINAALFVINLLPITPFDGGVLVRTYLTSRFAEIEGRDLMIRLGLIFGLLGMLTGFVFDLSVVVAISAFVLILHLHENMRWYEAVVQYEEPADYESPPDPSEFYAEPFGTQDEFGEFRDEPTHQEVIDRWRTQREQEKLEAENVQRLREEEQVDEILDKLHRHGRESLSSNDLHLLNRVSDRYRNREQHN